MLEGELENPESLDDAELRLIDFGFAKKFYYSIRTPDGMRHLHIHNCI